jgi:hypothetical protein
LLVVAYPILAVLALTPAVPVLSPLLCLAVLLAIGELWLRALVREPLTPAARLGLATTAGLVSLPLVALVLHVVGVRIEGHWLAAGLAVLVTGLGGVAVKQTAPTSTPAVGPHTTHPGNWVGPHPRHWVGRVNQAGTTTSQRLSTTLAVGVPALLAILIGGTATVVYQRLPHPAEPGYTSLALSGWAAGIAHPVTFPAAGLEVPLEVSSAGEPSSTAHVLVRVGGRMIAPGAPMTITAGTRALRVHVPAPADGCLHAIRISLGPSSTVFYGRGPGPARIVTRRGPAPC